MLTGKPFIAILAVFAAFAAAAPSGSILYTSQKGYYLGKIDVSTGADTHIIPHFTNGKPSVDKCIGLSVVDSTGQFCFSNDDPGDGKHQYNSSGVICGPVTDMNSLVVAVDWDTGKMIDPTGVALFADGALVYVDQGLNKAFYVSKYGASPVEYAPPTTNVLLLFDVAVDDAQDLVFFALNGARDDSYGAVWVYQRNGVFVAKLFPGVSYVYSIAADTVNQWAWIVSGKSQSTLSCAPYGSTPCPSSAGQGLGVLATGVAVAQGTDLVLWSSAAGTTTGAIGYLNTTDGNLTTLATGLNTPFRLAYTTLL